VKIEIVGLPPALGVRVVEPVRLDDFFAWAGRIVGNVGARADLAVARTRDGWPMYLVRTETGAVAAIYRFHEYAGALVLETPPDPLDVPALTELLGRARPDFRDDEALSLAELWDP
jgi:hypothetical protein